VITFPGLLHDDTSEPVCGYAVRLGPFVPGQDGKAPVAVPRLPPAAGDQAQAWESSGPSGV